MVAKDEGLEEPAGVGEVPFGRRGVRHRLEGRVGVGERRGDRLAQRPDGAVALGQRRGRRGVCLSGHFAAPYTKKLTEVRSPSPAKLGLGESSRVAGSQLR